MEEADKLALRALSEWDAGDEKKAVKYADKASRKADRSYKSAIETERALANIMAGLKEVFARTFFLNLHAMPCAFPTLKRYM